MRLFCCVVLGFVFVVNSKRLDEKIKHRIKPNGPELTFNDVIQNISSVNEVLKDLIRNYKHLKKIFESDELKKSKQVSESIEDVFEDSNKKRKRNRNDDPKSKEDTNKLDSYHVTRIFYSEETIPEKSSKELNVNFDDEDTSTDTSEETSPENTIEKLETSTENTKEKHEIRKKNTYGLEIPVFDEADVKEQEYIGNNDRAAIQTFSNTIQLVEQLDLQPKENKQPDTNYTDGSNTVPLEQEQKWEYEPNLRRIPAQSPLIIISNSSGFNQDYDELIDKKDNNVFINSEQFKTDILRSALSEPCLKLVIRKCYQSCKKVIKRVCRQYKCTKEFKSKYETSIKHGCIQYFEGEKKDSDKEFRVGKDIGNEDLTRGGYLAAACFPYENTNSKLKQNNEKVKIKKLKGDKETKINKITREQHELRGLDGEKHLALRNETIISTIEDPNKNILRDGLEKACQQISNSKCKKACNFGYTEACRVQKCNKDKRREFKKECKEQCQKAFDGKGGTDTGSGSSSSSSSDSSSKSSSSESSE